MVRSTLVSAGCSLRGGDLLTHNAPPLPSAPGIRATDSSVRLVTTRCSAGHPSSPPVPIAAVEGTGSLEFDPSVILEAAGNAALVSSGMSLSSKPRTLLGVSQALLGGHALVDYYAEPNELAYLLLGAPGPRLEIPGIGAIYADPSTVTAVGPVNTDATGHSSLRVLVPNNPGLVGTHVAWQALAQDAEGGSWRFSNPAASLIR